MFGGVATLRCWGDCGLTVVGGLITLRSGSSAFTDRGTKNKQSNDDKYFIILTPSMVLYDLEDIEVFQFYLIKWLT